MAVVPRSDSPDAAVVKNAMIRWCSTSPMIVPGLVLDNASYHHSATTQAGFAVFEEQLMPLFLPAYCSNLNPIERYWRHLKDSACANRLFPSIQALVDSVRANLNHQNDCISDNRLAISKDL